MKKIRFLICVFFIILPLQNLKSEIIDSLLSFASTQSKENLLNEILVDYLSLIDDDRLSELEDIIVNQFGES